MLKGTILKVRVWRLQKIKKRIGYIVLYLYFCVGKQSVNQIVIHVLNVVKNIQFLLILDLCVILFNILQTFIRIVLLYNLNLIYN